MKYSNHNEYSTPCGGQNEPMYNELFSFSSSSCSRRNYSNIEMLREHWTSKRHHVSYIRNQWRGLRPESGLQIFAQQIDHFIRRKTLCVQYRISLRAFFGRKLNNGEISISIIILFSWRQLIVIKMIVVHWYNPFPNIIIL